MQALPRVRLGNPFLQLNYMAVKGQIVPSGTFLLAMAGDHIFPSTACARGTRELNAAEGAVRREFGSAWGCSLSTAPLRDRIHQVLQIQQMLGLERSFRPF